MQRAEQTAADRGDQHAEPRAAGEMGGRIGAHRAEDERAFVPEIDAAGFLGEALAETDEKERRRHAQCAGERRDCEGGERAACHHTLLRGWNQAMRP